MQMTDISQTEDEMKKTAITTPKPAPKTAAKAEKLVAKILAPKPELAKKKALKPAAAPVLPVARKETAVVQMKEPILASTPPLPTPTTTAPALIKEAAPEKKAPAAMSQEDATAAAVAASLK